MNTVKVNYEKITQPENTADIVIEKTTAEDVLTTVKEKMMFGIAHFVFIKKDGTIREAFGTINAARILELAGPKAAGDGRIASVNATAQNYFDIGACEWKAFVKENLIIVF